MADYDSSLPVRTEAAGDVDVNISDAVTPSQKLVIEADGSINVRSTDLDTRDLEFATDKVDVSGSDVAATVTATDLDIRDLVAAIDSVQANLFDEAGAAYSLTNPLPVEMVSDASGDEVCDFNTSSSVVKDASVSHDYTVTAAKTLLLDQVWASASGKIKVEILINGALEFVAFNSTANPNIEIPIKKICKVAATQVVSVTITNLDNQAQDVYSTVLGIEI